MSTPIGIGVIGLGESGQNHLEVISGDRVRPQPLSEEASEKFDVVQVGKKFAKRLLGRETSNIAQAASPDPGIESVNVIAVSDVDEARLASTKQKFQVPHGYTNYKELLARPDIDAVMIATPPMFHRDLTIEAARHGKHVFCEKPMAMTSAHCLEMLEATEKAGVLLQIGYMLRFSSERGRIADAIRNQDIGRPVLFREIMSLRAGGDQQWIHDERLGGGIVWEASHVIDFVRYLFGDPDIVFGIGGRYKPNKTTAIDTYAASFVFPSGDRAQVGDSYALKGFGWEKEQTGCRRHRTEIDIVGPGGYIQFPDADLSKRLTICTYGATDDKIEKFAWDSPWGEWGANGYKNQLAHFVECVQQNKMPRASGEEGLRTALLAETILESIRTGEARKFGALR
jgi:predicted dehydrogenase